MQLASLVCVIIYPDTNCVRGASRAVSIAGLMPGNLSSLLSAPPDAPREGAPYLELHFRPDHELVTVVRRFVADLAQQYLIDPEGTSRIALAIHELLENAVKYAIDGEATLRVDVDLDRHPRPVRIALRNRARPEDIVAIGAILDDLARAPCAQTFYQQLLVRRANVKGRSSGLGLARLCAEGDMKLSYRVIDHDVTVLEATTSVAGKSCS